MTTSKINALLLFLILLDMTLAFTAYCLPQFWFTLFHGTPYVDPQGLLRRTAGNWLAFALLQILAYLRWKNQPYWLVLVAGVRLSDIFTDWSYLYFAQNLTCFGGFSLFIASPANLYFGWFLLKGSKILGRPTGERRKQAG